MTTIGEVVSRIRNIVKGVKQDSFLTDRFIYSLVIKHAHLLMRRQDNLNKVLRFNSIFSSMDCINLIDINKIESGCNCIKSDCKIKRTECKLPLMMEGYWGPLIRSVTSIDGSEQVYLTLPSTYETMQKSKNFKYNKKKYFWYLNGYLYIPNVDWSSIKVEAVISPDPNTGCEQMRNRFINIPQFLFSEIEIMVLKDLNVTLSIPNDNTQDNKNIIR